ncbi:MAG: type II toxin-antitoxin system PemK/MazF family toxin [bacterium]
MTTYEPGQVITIPFPFTDLTTTKKRPALIISSRVFNQSHDDLIVVAITSQKPFDLKSDEYLLPNTEQQAAGLPKPSKIRCGKIVTIHQRLVRKMLGQISTSALKEIIKLVISNLP